MKTHFLMARLICIKLCTTWKNGTCHCQLKSGFLQPWDPFVLNATIAMCSIAVAIKRGQSRC